MWKGIMITYNMRVARFGVYGDSKINPILSNQLMVSIVGMLAPHMGGIRGFGDCFEYIDTKTSYDPKLKTCIRDVAIIPLPSGVEVLIERTRVYKKLVNVGDLDPIKITTDPKGIVKSLICCYTTTMLEVTANLEPLTSSDPRGSEALGMFVKYEKRLSKKMVKGQRSKDTGMIISTYNLEHVLKNRK